MRKNLTVQEYTDKYFEDCHLANKWELIGWITLIGLLLAMNFAVLGAIIEFLILSPY